MKTEVTGSDSEQGIGIEVFDEHSNRHWLALNWDGSIREHQQESYPHKVENRTDEQQRLMTAVERRARYAAHQEFPDAGILDPGLNPDVLQRAIVATQQMDAQRFADEFREFYQSVVDPERFLPPEISFDDAFLVDVAFSVTDDDRVGEVGGVRIAYIDQNGEPDGTGHANQFDDTDHVKLYLPPTNYEGMEYPDDFFKLVQQNLVIQVRDLYEAMGETPPEPYQVEGTRVWPIEGEDRPAILD